MARWYGAALTTGATVNDVRSWTDRIRAVTAEQVQGAAKQWLEKQRSVTGYLIKDKSPQAGEAVMTRRACMFFAAAVLIALPNVVSAMTIEKIVTSSGIEAWLVREKLGTTDHVRITLPVAEPARMTPASPGQRISPPICSTKAPASWTARPFMSGWKTTQSRSAFRLAATHFTARCAR